MVGFVLTHMMIGYACDNCNIYLNLSPNDYRNSVGVYMRQRQLFGTYDLFGEMIATRHTGHGNDMAFWGENVYETYQTYELRGTYYLRDKWNFSAVVPYVQNSQKIGNVDRYIAQGIGDPTLMTAYQLINTKKDTGKVVFSNRLTAGIGLKFPLGKTDLSYENGIPNLDLQPGTGTWDIMTFATYTFKYKSIGINFIANFRRNGRDATLYRYGFTSNATSNLFFDWTTKASTIRFLAGTYLENAKMDATYSDYYQNEQRHDDTGGTVVFANGGIQFFTNAFTIFGEYQYAFSSQLNGYTQLLTSNKINLGITYNF